MKKRKAFSEQVFQEWKDTTKKITGKSLEEWNEIWAEKRRQAISKGNVSLDKFYSPYTAVQLSKKYGLFPEDWILCDGVPVGRLERDDPNYRGPSHEGQIASETIAYRLDPDKFPRI